jgi:hypothetical protein
MIEQAAVPAIAGWETFYVIIGAVGGSLTGLMFVVVALAADRGLLKPSTTNAWATPTVVHFCAVLLIGAVLTTPEHTILSLGLCLAGVGVAGLGYVRWTWVQAKRQDDYKAERSDIVWFFVLPSIAYATILVAARIVWTNAAAALYVVGAAVMLLLYAGIHNAWDSAIYIGIRPPAESAGAEKKTDVIP